MSFVTTSTQSRRPVKRIAALAVVVLLCVAAAGAVLLHYFWPFTQSSVRARLGESTATTVRFGNFHEKYFPPGCVMENVVFQRGNSGPFLISIRHLTISSNLVGLLRHHISLLHAEGMRITLGRSDFSANMSSTQQTIVDTLVADDAVLDVHRKAKPMRFVFHKFQLQNLGGSGATKFFAVFDNPMPAGLVHTSGQFGAWNSSDPAATSISGTYELSNANLGVFDSIGGVLSSDGNFEGTFKQMEVEGSTTTPEFEVVYTHHKLPLQTRFKAAVNATNGETTLQSVNADFGRDQIDAHGRIGRQADGKHAAVIELNCDRGRIEDTFYPFIRSSKSPLIGNVAFQMHVMIPSGRERFLKKIEVSSDFHIQDARFTNPQTQSRLSKVSERHDQKQPDENSLADLSGNVRLLHGIAQFSKLSARDGNATAWFRGNYDLTNEHVDLHGQLTTEASLGKTTSGIKSVFAKALEPLFKKGSHQKVVPVRIGGTYHNPSFGLDGA
jgi:AsmA-like C-terminal region